MAHIDALPVVEGEHKVGDLEPRTKTARTSKGPEPPLITVEYTEDDTALEYWSSPVAQNW